MRPEGAGHRRPHTSGGPAWEAADAAATATHCEPAVRLAGAGAGVGVGVGAGGGSLTAVARSCLVPVLADLVPVPADLVLVAVTGPLVSRV